MAIANAHHAYARPRRGAGRPLPAAAEGVDLDAITAELEREGVRAFCDSYAELLRCIEGKRSELAAVS